MVEQIVGTWQPIVSAVDPAGLEITFGTPSNGWDGRFVKTGALVWVSYRLNFGIHYVPGVTSGRLRVLGLPYPALPAANSQTACGNFTFQCLNKPNYTQFGSLLFPGDDFLHFFAAAEGQAEGVLNITDINNDQPIVLLEGVHTYLTDP